VFLIAIYSDMLDPLWIGNLSGKFDYVSIDKAHVIKIEATKGHLVVNWLDAKYIFLITATVLPNRVDDLSGYMKFVESRNDLWSAANLQALGASANVNPFQAQYNNTAVEQLPNPV